eukprot:scaffold3677_cov20-Tisochrysis_lutea.AAC.1
MMRASSADALSAHVFCKFVVVGEMKFDLGCLFSLSSCAWFVHLSSNRPSYLHADPNGKEVWLLKFGTPRVLQLRPAQQSGAKLMHHGRWGHVRDGGQPYIIIIIITITIIDLVFIGRFQSGPTLVTNYLHASFADGKRMTWPMFTPVGAVVFAAMVGKAETAKRGDDNMLSIVCICMQEKVSDVCCAVGAVAIAALIDRAAHCAHHMSHLTCTPHLWQQERERVANVCRPVGAAAIAALMDEANKLGEDEICVICEWDMSQGWRIASWDSQGAGMLCDFYINSKKGVEGSSNPPDCDAAWKCSEVYLPLARVAL